MGLIEFFLSTFFPQLSTCHEGSSVLKAGLDYRVLGFRVEGLLKHLYQFTKFLPEGFGRVLWFRV